MYFIQIETDKKIIMKEKCKYMKKSFISAALSSIPIALYYSMPEYHNLNTLASAGIITLPTAFSALKNFCKSIYCNPIILEIDTGKKEFSYHNYLNDLFYKKKYETIVDAEIFYQNKEHGTIAVSLITEDENELRYGEKSKKYIKKNLWVPDVKNPGNKIKLLKPYVKSNSSLEEVVSSL